MEKTAFVIGASGSVGAALMQELQNCGKFANIVSFGRKTLGFQKVTEVVLLMTPEALENAVIQKAQSIEGPIVGFSVLGVGANTASLTFEEHCAIDVALNRAFAAGLKKCGKSRHLNLMSAVGANPKARSTGSGAAGFPRYSRVKGEAEEAVKQAGPQIISIFRPAMIIGSVHTPWFFEKVLPLFAFMTPKNMLSIRTTEIAKSMVTCGLHTPQASAVYHYPEMMELQ